MRRSEDLTAGPDSVTGVTGGKDLAQWPNADITVPDTGFDPVTFQSWTPSHTSAENLT